jgi:hypothetical protein
MNHPELLLPLACWIVLVCALGYRAICIEDADPRP